jgi:probable F420-dependent oxidoreductase
MKHGVSGLITDRGLDMIGYARLIEDLGFESLFMGEHTVIPVQVKTSHPFGGGVPDGYERMPSPWICLALAAAVTKRIRLGTDVALIPEREPIGLAKDIATLDFYSGGRLLIGVGAGWLREESEVMRVNFRRRWDITRDYIQAMKELWTKDEAAYNGEFISFPSVLCYPKPAQKPHPPILIGAGGLGHKNERALRNTVAFADGWMPVAVTPEDMKGHLATLKQLCSEAGRDFSKLEISVVTDFRMALDKPKVGDLIRRYEDCGVHRIIWATDQLLTAEPYADRMKRIADKVLN